MVSRKVKKMLKKLESSNPKKRVEAVRELEKVLEVSGDESMDRIVSHIIPLLRHESERVRTSASSLMLQLSKTDEKAIVEQYREIDRNLKWAFSQMKAGSVSRWSPYTNMILSLENAFNLNKKLGSKIAPLITRALKFPIYNPQNLSREKVPLYVAVIKVLGKIGRKRPNYVEMSIPYVYKILLDSHRFDSIKRYFQGTQNNIRFHAINTLKKVGYADPKKVVPTIVSGLNEDNKEIVRDIENVLDFLINDIESFFPALMDSLNMEDTADQEKISEYLVKLGGKKPDFVVPALVKRISDKRKNVRTRAISAIGSLIPDNNRYIPTVTPMLIKRLPRERGNEIKQAIANTLTIISFLNITVFKDHIPELIKAMEDDYYFVRWRTCQIIKNVGIFKKEYVIDALPSLIKGLDDPYVLVQQKAQEALDTLDVDKLEYLQAMRYIVRWTKALEKAKSENIKCLESQKVLIDAIKKVKQYDFGRSIYLSTTALSMMEEKGVPLSASIYSPPMQGTAEQAPGFSFGSHRYGPADEGVDIPSPTTDESIPLPPPPDTEEEHPPFAIPHAKKVEPAKTTAKLGIDEIFLMTTYGILLEHYVAAKRSKVDEEILASMLVAVKSFITDSFDLPDAVGGGKINLNTIDFGNFSVVLSTEKYLTMVAITESGDKEAIYNHLTKGLGKIEKKYHKVLKTWDGDMEELGDLSEYMKKIILK